VSGVVSGAAAAVSATGPAIATAGPDVEALRALPGFERGNPMYFENEVVDHLLGIVLELGAELWVVRDRQAFTEELLREHGIDLAARLQQGRPGDELQAKLKAERAAMIKRVYGRLYSRYGGDKAELAAAL
jgi:hypothetical protein